MFAGIEEEKAKEEEEEEEEVEADRTSVGSGSCEKGEKVKRGRGGGRKDGAGEVALTLKARRVMVSRELAMGGALHAEEESRSWEADGMGMMKCFSEGFEDVRQVCKNARTRHNEKCESARAHQLIRAEHQMPLAPAPSARSKDLKITPRVTQKGSGQSQPEHAFGKSRRCNTVT